MDLALIGRVVWRFKYVVAVGLSMAVVLALLSVVRISPFGSHHIAYRQKQQWASYTTLFVTQEGFPWGQVTSDAGPGPSRGTATSAAQTGDPLRFASLAILYSKLILSDPVRARMEKSGPINGTVDAAPVTTSSSSTDALPLISVAGISDSKEHSKELVARATAAFLSYFHAEEIANGIPPNNRVVISVINSPGATTLLADRTKTLPIVVFLTVALATFGLCFVLENLNPRTQAVAVRPVVSASPSIENQRSGT